MIYPRIIAHRCGGALAPENTLAGLRIAARIGCRGVEFDAMLGADGVPVLIHDETLERTTSGLGGVAAADSGQLLRLDAGCRHHRAFGGEPLPSLDQALRLCAALGLWANVEIKPATGHEAETGRAVARASAAIGGKLVLSSFSEVALQAAAVEAPLLPRAMLVEAVPTDWPGLLERSGSRALHCAANSLAEDVAHAVCKAGYPLACYTVNGRDEGARLFALGVSAVFSDRPDLWQAEEM
ncbi:MAG: glycerophosphodiester phosphodiesterase [Sterolibacteriaceae bacterium]|uniref:glycerophosphodiester phosphodiesterase n=1 Tax=Sulfuritalea sp. TaxID=2480090 RepID=UPI001A4B217E|nr:glycerophosphodiester phosphodiesterase [Sulfuritalea sp.]MBL8478593.1 glycerophosphodiester phosphodiesterase [Sterolibacteriaceae bacterium]MBN8475546.1 glycerophosphodiester phosphodiesterase [Sulfuritalea sp.]